MNESEEKTLNESKNLSEKLILMRRLFHFFIQIKCLSILLCLR